MGIGNKILHTKIRNIIGKIVSNNLQKRLTNVCDLKNIKNIEYLKYESDNKTEFVFEIEDGSVFSSWGFAYTKDKKVIDGVLPYSTIIPYYTEIGGRYVSYLMRSKKYIHGVSFSLQSIWNVCFGHWVHEALPKLFLLKDSGMLDKVETIIIGDGCNKAFHKDSIKLIVGKDKNIEYISDEKQLICENLILSSFPGTHTHSPAKWVCNKFLELVKEINIKNKSEKFHEKIYISRNKAKTRITINEDAIMKILEPLGYKLLYLEDHTFEKQILICHNAKKIISPHGSGLTNMVFCEKGKTALLDIIPSIRYESVYKDIANTIGLKYFEYVESDHNAFSYYGLTNHENNFDMKINIDKLMPYIEKIESL